MTQPGGSITGFFLDQPGLTSKWLELIREAAPDIRRIAVLVDTTTGPWQLAAIRAAASMLRIEHDALEMRSAGELGHALGAGVKGGSRALIQLSSPLFDSPLFDSPLFDSPLFDSPLFTKQIAEFTVRHRLAAISLFKRFAEAGGLMAYGPDQAEYYKRLPAYIDKILKGANPADLPIEQPTRFAFVINLKTAKVFGLALPQSLVTRADEVIQ